ncbi:M23 family metallopeptidase [Sanguibacter massiliensis]|uniref:M23 family metallopeptidase n=1 Tax=Sanguibacter massiliensis TaxID=1973217 RepID=UPI0013EDF666|nr:M23 family metallopeptidase [Sanguibacter massiliensis]
MTYSNPAPGRISSRYDLARLHPVTGEVRPHEGTDVAGPTGTPVLAVHDGVVTRSETLSPTYGRLQRVYVSDGSLETRYLHLSRRDVVVGQRVSAGDRLGLMGTSGFVTGPHLHLEIRVGGRAIDPEPWLAARGITLGVDPAPGTPIPLPTDLPEDAMRRTTHTRTKALALPLAWKTLPVNDKGHVSACTTVGRGTLVADLTLTGVPRGREVQVRAIVVESDPDGKNAKIVHRGSIVEIIGTGGSTFGQIVAPFELAKIVGRRERRVRIQALALDKGIRLVHLTTTVDHIPA